MSNDSVSAIEVVIPVESAIVNESKIESDKAEKITKNLSFYEKLKLRITSRPMMGTIFILFFLPFFFMGCILTIVMYMLYILIMSPRIILLCCFGVYINSDDFFCFELKVFELSVNIGLGLMFFFLWFPLSIVLVIPFIPIMFCICSCLYIKQSPNVYRQYTLELPKWLEQPNYYDPYDESPTVLNDSLSRIVCELLCLLCFTGFQFIFYPLGNLYVLSMSVES